MARAPDRGTTRAACEPSNGGMNPPTRSAWRRRRGDRGSFENGVVSSVFRTLDWAERRPALAQALMDAAEEARGAEAGDEDPIQGCCFVGR
jgi:hypothetical protein